MGAAGLAGGRTALFVTDHASVVHAKSKPAAMAFTWLCIAFDQLAGAGVNLHGKCQRMADTDQRALTNLGLWRGRCLVSRCTIGCCVLSHWAVALVEVRRCGIDVAQRVVLWSNLTVKSRPRLQPEVPSARSSRFECSQCCTDLQKGLCSGHREAVAGVHRSLVLPRVKAPPHGIVMLPCLELCPDLRRPGMSAMRQDGGLAAGAGHAGCPT
jgi:hypothetical protein